MWNRADAPPSEANDYLVGWWARPLPEDGLHFVQVVAGYTPAAGWTEYAARLTHWRPLLPPPASDF